MTESEVCYPSHTCLLFVYKLFFHSVLPLLKLWMILKREHWLFGDYSLPSGGPRAFISDPFFPAQSGGVQLLYLQFSQD